MRGPCTSCGMSEWDCLDAALSEMDGDPGVCCADCEHPPVKP